MAHSLLKHYASSVMKQGHGHVHNTMPISDGWLFSSHILGRLVNKLTVCCEKIDPVHISKGD